MTVKSLRLFSFRYEFGRINNELKRSLPFPPFGVAIARGDGLAASIS